MVYKSLNGLAPDYMHSMFVDRDSVNPCSLTRDEKSHFHIMQMYVQMYCEYDIRLSLFTFAPMQT